MVMTTVFGHENRTKASARSIVAATVRKCDGDGLRDYDSRSALSTDHLAEPGCSQSGVHRGILQRCPWRTGTARASFICSSPAAASLHR